jgi:DNA-binding CsgD family transcriptional regulator/N-acetylneuraminic acid mutarotase
MPELGEPLSDRERDVLQCLAEGASNQEIANLLSISPNTVKVHLRNIYTKLGVGSRTEATTVALQQGAVSIPGIDVEVEPRPDEIVVPESGNGLDGLPASPAAGAEASTVPSPPRRGPRPLLWIALAGVGFLLLIGGLALARPLWEAAAATAGAPGTATPTEEAFRETRLGESWLKSRSMATGRAGMAVASVGLNIYQIGGETAAGVDNTVTVFNTQERRWQEAAPKLTAVSDAAAAVLAGEIYVVGGRRANGQATTVVEAYSPLNDGWRPVTSLPEPLAAAVVLVSGDLLYVFGGEVDGEASANAYVYNPGQQEWRSLPPLRQARAAAGAGVLNGEFYVAGGRDGTTLLDSCERFDPAAESWGSCPPLSQPRAGAGSATLLNKLYLFGGIGDAELSTGQVYDAGREAWDEIETLMLAEAHAWNRPGVAVVETRLYVLGGELGESLSPDVYVYTPFFYQFFIPAASSSGPEE